MKNAGIDTFRGVPNMSGVVTTTWLLSSSNKLTEVEWRILTQVEWRIPVNKAITGPDTGLSPDRRQAIIWTVDEYWHRHSDGHCLWHDLGALI